MFFLAKRYLLIRKRQTLLILMGIILGSAAYIGISGLMLGFQNHIVAQLVDNDAHIRISSREEYLTPTSLDQPLFNDAAHVFWQVAPSGRKDNAHIEYAQGWFERLNGEPHVLAYAPQFQAEALMRRAQVAISIRLVGTDPNKQIKVTNIRDYMVDGKFEEIGQSGNRLVIGDGLMNKLGTHIGDNVQLSVARGNPVPFKIKGVFHTGIKAIDDGTAFGALRDVQNLNQTPSQITDIAVRLADVGKAQSLAQTWSTTSRDKVLSWSQANEGMMSVFKTQDFVRLFMTVAILVVAGFGIYNVLSMMVSQKRREIAILRSMGYDPQNIMTLFFIQGVILGLIGGLAGILVGYGICDYVSTIPVSKERMISGPGGFMPIAFDPSIYLGGFFMALGASILASLVPARAAGKMEPIEIIRSE